MLTMSRVASLPATKACPDVTGVIPVSIAIVVVCGRGWEVERGVGRGIRMGAQEWVRREGTLMGARLSPSEDTK